MKKITSDFFRGDAAKGLAGLLCVAFAAVFAIWMQGPPAAVPASAPPEQFSSARAMTDLHAISREPHPIGSAGAANVREYLRSRLSALGLTSEIQQATVVNRKSIPFRAGMVQNVIARMPGTKNGKAILLAAHYDSAPGSFGASDDGAGVVAILETLRALKSGPPLKNDVIALFTDGEEEGLLGAGGFVIEHPWMKDVGLVLNFEARGHTGPSVMFETSRQNGWLINQFAQSVPRPVGSSMGYDVYRLLTLDTDLSVFKEANVNGLNFAFIKGVTHYHNALDNFENIDERSLQHHGSYALALTRHFGNQNFENTKAPNAVYFDLLGRVLVRYPASWSIVLTVLTALLFVGVVIVGFRRHLLSLKGIGFGFVSFVLCLGLAAVAAILLWNALSLVHKDYRSLPQGVPYNGSIYVLACVALAIAIVSVVFALIKRVSMPNLATGALLCWLLLLLAVNFYLPGTAFLLLWPLFFSLIGIDLLFYFSKDGMISPKLLIAVTLCAIPGAILLSAAIANISAALPLRLSWAIALMVALSVGLLIPLLRVSAGRGKWLVPLAASVVCVALLVVGGFSARYDAKHPALTNVFYLLNADTGEAIWGSDDERPNDWTTPLFANATAHAASNERPAIVPAKYQQPAAAAGLQAPEITLIGDSINDGVRTLKLRVKSLRQANLISLYVDQSAKVRGAHVNGKLVNFWNAVAQGQASHPWSMRFFAVPVEGIELTLEVMSDKPFQIRAIDQTQGLPALPPMAVDSRPENLMPSPNVFSDSTLVSKSFTF
jgi:hypothetical protein